MLHTAAATKAATAVTTHQRDVNFILYIVYILIKKMGKKLKMIFHTTSSMSGKRNMG